MRLFNKPSTPTTTSLSNSTPHGKIIYCHLRYLEYFANNISYCIRCGHCKTLAPEYAKAAQALAGSNVKLAKVDATEQTEAAKAYEVKGFPTLKFFKNGKPSDYNGGRTEGEIVSWLNKKTGPAARAVNSEDDLLKLQEAHNVFVLGVFDNVESDAAKAFVSAANDDDLHVFAITSDAGVKSKLGVSADSVVVLKNFDDLRADLAVTAETSSEDIIGFALANSSPLVQEFNAENSKKIFGSKITKHLLFFTNKDADHHKSAIESYTAAASQFKGQILFVNVPTSEKRILEYFEIAPDAVPAAVLADLGSASGIKKFPFTGEHTTEGVSAFVNEFFAGTLKPFLKSEEVQEDDTTGDVVILKGKSFNDLVINNDKDVLVEFYAPWCGHCKKLAPIWDELGAKVKEQSSNIVIAKIDSTANEIDVPGVAVKGFPTIYFFKGNDKANPVAYNDGRDLESFLKFLNANTHHAFEHEEL